ncbi:hypothetical protein ANH9381_0186 [Aggregatibacter actinomycetemcomitans ANH9381]|nr:hypothetical protein ANH9381_0186 [Aggregatibacter actinomycetemcomitans ANH9381]
MYVSAPAPAWDTGCPYEYEQRNANVADHGGVFVDGGGLLLFFNRAQFIILKSALL